MFMSIQFCRSLTAVHRNEMHFENVEQKRINCSIVSLLLKRSRVVGKEKKTDYINFAYIKCDITFDFRSEKCPYEIICLLFHLRSMIQIVIVVVEEIT